MPGFTPLCTSVLCRKYFIYYVNKLGEEFCLMFQGNLCISSVSLPKLPVVNLQYFLLLQVFDVKTDLYVSINVSGQVQAEEHCPLQFMYFQV